MKIGMMLPAVYAIGNPFSGVREQALAQANALEDLGHTVVRLSSWEKYNLASFDVLHYFFGGHWMNQIDSIESPKTTIRVFAPIIDTLQSNRNYRLAARLGTLHDKFTTVQAQYMRQANNANVVVARSAFEADKLRNGLGVPASKIRVVLNGCAPPEKVDVAAARKMFQLDEDFVLHISRITNPGKNVLNLIVGVGSLGLPLVIAGTHEPGRAYDAIVSAAERFPSVRLIGKVSHETKNALYAACRVFCLPSTREGTGLVALEAASYGANVVITGNGGPPDYFGDFAHYPKNTSAEMTAEAVRQAWLQENNKSLQLHVCKNLTWENSARQLESVYCDFMT